MASTITSAFRHQAAKSGSSGVKGSSTPPAAASRASMALVSQVSFSRCPTRMQRTSKPASSSRRAQATPSPPLLPGPQKQTARPGALAAVSMAASASAFAARSISSSEGTPRSSMALRSNVRICSAVAILMCSTLPFLSKSVSLYAVRQDSSISFLRFSRFCDINKGTCDEGKKSSPRPGRERPSPAESGCGAGLFGSSWSGPGDRDGFAPRYRGQSACAAGAGLAGGNAEGLPFVPISWAEGIFYCPNRKEELDNEVVGRARPRLD